MADETASADPRPSVRLEESENPPSAGRRGARWWAGRAVRWLLLAIVLGLVVRSLADGLGQVRRGELDFRWPLVALSALSMAVSMSLVAESIRVMLASVGWPVAWPAVAGATWVSRLGKYVPGKVASIVGAAYLLGRHKVPAALAAGIVLLNTLLTVIVGLVVASPLMLWQPVRSRLPLAWLWSAIAVAGGLVATHPRVVFPLINRLLARWGRPALSVRPSLALYARPVALILGQWLFAGLSLWLLVNSLGDVSIRQLPLLTGASALAVTVGFLVLFAPGGLGVRESIYLIVLASMLDLGAAAVLTIATRVVYTGMEAILAGVGLAMLRRGPSVPAGGAT